MPEINIDDQLDNLVESESPDKDNETTYEQQCVRLKNMRLGHVWKKVVKNYKLDYVISPEAGQMKTPL
jgi:hypothetical protein